MLKYKLKTSEYRSKDNTHNYLSYSQLKLFLKHPKEYEHSLTSTSEIERVGTLTHLLFLEPERKEEIIEIENRLTKENKAKVEQARKENKLDVTSKELKQVTQMAQALNENKIIQQIKAKDHDTEVSIFSIFDNVRVRGRLDLLTKDNKLILDIKYFNELSEFALRGQISRMKYDLQAAFYARLVEQETKIKPVFLLAFVQDREPFLTQVVELTEQTINNAKTELTMAVNQFLLYKTKELTIQDNILSI